MEATGTGQAWPPWPELTHGHRPVLVAPFDPARPAAAPEGWAGPAGGIPDPRPDWSAAFDGARLVVRRPGGAAWYDGPVPATREWARALRTHRTLVLVTGRFTTAFDLATAATAGLLLLVTVPVRLVDAH